MLNCVPSMIGSQLPGCIRNKSNLLRLNLQNNVNKLLFVRIAFNIELGFNQLLQLTYIIQDEVLTFTRHFTREMGVLQDRTLGRELKILDKLGHFKTSDS